MKIDKILSVAKAKRGVERGEKWQWMYSGVVEWTDIKDTFCWGVDLNNYEFRIKPEPKLRPWKPEEVPVGALLRNDCGLKTTIMWSNKYRFGWLEGRDSCLDMFTNNDVCFADALTYIKHLEYSTDHGKTWQPCGILED